jgi:hypothetical protein
MQRAVLEVKHEPTRDSITPSELDQLTISEQAPLERAQGKKAVDKALRVAHYDGLRAHLFSWNEKSAAEQCSDEGTATVFDQLRSIQVFLVENRQHRPVSQAEISFLVGAAMGFAGGCGA